MTPFFWCSGVKLSIASEPVCLLYIQIKCATWIWTYTLMAYMLYWVANQAETHYSAAVCYIIITSIIISAEFQYSFCQLSFFKNKSDTVGLGRQRKTDALDFKERSPVLNQYTHDLKKNPPPQIIAWYQKWQPSFICPSALPHTHAGR